MDVQQPDPALPKSFANSLYVGKDLRRLIDAALEPLRLRRPNIMVMHGPVFGAGKLSSDFLTASLSRHGKVSRLELGHTALDTELVAGAVREMRSRDINLVVALGGGRVMDIAKVCSALRDHDFATDLETILGERHDLIPKREVALVAVPTTPGTGSEATALAVLTGRNNRKLIALSRYLKPNAGVIFPPLYSTVPANVTRQSLMDGFTHALEALWSRAATPGSDEYAIQALDWFGQAMVPFYRNPRDPELARLVATAASYGGLALGSAYTSLCHALAFPLAESLHLGHGQCCALTAAQVAEFNAGHESAALHRGVRAMGLNGVDELPAFIRRVRNDLEDYATLSSFGVTPDALPEIAAGARGNMVSNNIKHTEGADLVAILRAAL